jgi:MscS family membrane protein
MTIHLCAPLSIAARSVAWATRCRLLRLAGACLLLCGVASAAASDPPSVSSGPAAASTAADPLERQTPRSSVRGYLVACRDGDYARAARHLDLRGLSATEREARGPTLARQLKTVLDRTLWIDLEALSDQPRGELDDGLPPRRDRVGTLTTERGPVEVWVERVGDAPGRRAWKISSVTVAGIPALYAEFGYGPLGEWLPAPFFELRLFEVQLWQWLGLMVAVFLAWVLSWFAATGVVRTLRPLVARSATTFDDRLLAITVGPLRLLAATLLFALSTLLLDLSVPAQRFFAGAERMLVFVAVLWLLLRLVDVFSEWTSARLLQRGQVALNTMLPVGRRVAKVVLGSLAFIALLQNLGFNVTGLIAGLGVGGLALALAAQKTLENLFGGISVIADQPVRVGDFCRFGDKVGIVEDIGLRSTRVRTLDRTVVTIPNAEFAQTQLENFAKRDRIWYHPSLGLRYETTPDQIRYILVEIRKLLYAHPRVEPDPARIRFAGFGAYSLDLDIFAYVRATDYGEYLEVAEDLNLRIMDIVERAGSGFAFPSQTLYVEQGEGLDAEKARAAQAEVETWREKRELMLPKFPREEIERLAATLDYPPRGSALHEGT